MYIDIHKHSAESPSNTLVLRNLFPEQMNEIVTGKYYSIGLHPWYSNIKNFFSILNTLREYALKKEVIAIGETGLDQKVDIPYIKQIGAFESQVEIAEKHKLPVIVHCVRAYNDLIRFRKKADQSLPWIIHWFNASKQIADELLSMNCYLSYGCMLFNETSKAFHLFKQLPVEKIFFETDDTEYSIEKVYNKAAELKNITVSELQNKIILNFKNCFQIKPEV